ncbi:MAG: hypothetical protein L6W00_11470 [Lentisphaeria bacterium]|nr:MAG: hypothetical protein L6W00_11470 [Lentisphaeria bacterium]
MKKYRFILPALLAVGILTTTFATETVPRITADGNAPSGILRCGETAELTIALRRCRKRRNISSANSL